LPHIYANAALRILSGDLTTYEFETGGDVLLRRHNDVIGGWWRHAVQLS